MATIGDRGNTWANSDGLVVGFGTNKPTYVGSDTKNYAGVGGVKSAQVQFDYAHINAGKAVNVPIPAGSRVMEVKLVVGTAWAGAANALIVGDGSNTAGFITAAGNGAVANLTAGAVLAADGVYVYDDTADGDITAREFKLYAAADTIDVDSADSDWTAGTATLVVSYI